MAITAFDMPGWREAGFDKPNAEHWYSAGFTPTTARMWWEICRDPATARRWVDAGFTVELAAPLIREGRPAP